MILLEIELVTNVLHVVKLKFQRAQRTRIVSQKEKKGISAKFSRKFIIYAI